MPSLPAGQLGDESHKEGVRGTALASARPAVSEDAPLPIPKIRDVVRIWVLYAHHISGGNKRAMAEALGVSVKTIHNKTARYRREGCLP